MRAFSRTLGAVAAAAALATGTAACSSNLEEPGPEAVNSVIPETEPSEPSSSETTTTATETTTVAAETTSEKPDDGAYSYDRVKNNDGYITKVGLGEAGKEASFPACDGRYILIVDSVIDEGDEKATFDRLVQAVMFADPEGKEFTVPGHCDSLRKSVDGKDIYPIYLDFGSDKDAACRAKSTYGGNVRPLVDGSFPDASAADVDEARLALDPC